MLIEWYRYGKKGEKVGNKYSFLKEREQVRNLKRIGKGKQLPKKIPGARWESSF